MQTGFTITSVLNAAILALSLLMAIVLFIKHAYKSESLLLLLLLTLTIAIKHSWLLLFHPGHTADSSLPYPGSIAFLILLLIFRSASHNSQYRSFLINVAVAYSTFSITLYLTGAISSYTDIILLAEAVSLCVFSVLALFTMMNDKKNSIFSNAAFWIAGGTLAFYAMRLATDFLLPATGYNKTSIQVKELLQVFSLVQLLFYLIAATRCGEKNPDEFA